MNRILLPLPALFILVGLVSTSPRAFSATVDLVGIDEDTNDAWRTTDVAKPFGDADDVYGTDGYFIGSFGDATDKVDPAYATVSLVGGVNGPEIAEPHQAKFDDVNQTGPGPVPDVITGDYWTGGGAQGLLEDIFTIELTQAGTYRVGVIGDQTPDNPPGLFWEASRGIGMKGPGGVDSGSIDITGPGESWRDADVDYVLFDITGDVGDVFTVYGENDSRWGANALGGVFFDQASNPNAPEISSFTADPTETDTPGTAINFTWQVEMPLDSLLLQPGDIDVLGDTDMGGAGGYTLDPGPDETTTYILEATLGGETGTASVRVAITPPEIVSFTSDKPSIAPGESFTLSWEVTPPYTTLTLQPGDIDVLGDTNASGVGSRPIDPGPSENTDYQLVAVRGASATTTADQRVQVFIPGTGITIVGIDEDTNDAWRTTDVVKPFGDVDNIYGTDGYYIASFGDGNDVSQPPYATVTVLVGGPEIAEPHQAKFDDVNQTGPGPVPDVITGDYWISSGATGQLDDMFSIELTQSASFRLGVIGDQTPDNPPGLFWEASRGIGVKGPGGVDTGSIDITGPGESWRDADVDYILFDITGNVGDVFIVYGEQDSRWSANALGGVFFDPTGGSRGPRFSVERSGDDLLFKWDSQGGKLYSLLSETDPSVAEPIDWSVFGSHQDIEATPPENTLTIPYPADTRRFFVISEFNAPPASIFSEDFEGGGGVWTTGSEGDLGTLWQVGAPTNVGPAAAHGGTNCYGTNIAGDYTINTRVWLRSPPIDLTNASGATLNFFQYVNIEEGFDFGTVSVLDAANDSLIAEIASPIDEQDPTDWEQFTKVIPAAALGKEIKIEFCLFTDDFDDPGLGPFAGWYIDDVLVTVP